MIRFINGLYMDFLRNERGRVWAIRNYKSHQILVFYEALHILKNLLNRQKFMVIPPSRLLIVTPLQESFVLMSRRKKITCALSRRVVLIFLMVRPYLLFLQIG